MTSEHGTVRVGRGGPQAGKLIAGRYELLRDLSADADAHSYEARDQQSGEHVRLTLVHRFADAQALARCRTDLDTVRTLEHPGTVRPRAIGTTDEGQVFVISDLVEGVPLDVWLTEQGAFEGPQAAALIAQVLQVLELAHQQGVIHRDIKPAKLVLANGELIKVRDLGTVLALTGDFSAVNPQASVRLGVPAYTAPELLMGASATTATDVYSLGLTLAEMLTGRPVVEAPTVAQAITRQLSLDPDAVADSVGDPELGDIVRRALSRSPEDRYADASEMLEAIENVKRMLGGASAGSAAMLQDELQRADEPEAHAGEGVGEAASLAATPGPIGPVTGEQLLRARPSGSLEAVEAEVLRRVTAAREAVPDEERRGKGWIFLLIFIIALGAAAALLFWPPAEEGDDDSRATDTDEAYELVVVGDDAASTATGDTQTDGAPETESAPTDETEPAPSVESESPPVADADTPTPVGDEPTAVDDQADDDTPDDGELAADDPSEIEDEPAVDEPGPSDATDELGDATDQSGEALLVAEAGPPYRIEVRITSEPNRARLTIDGENVGRTPWEGVVESEDDTVTARLSKRDHERTYVRIDVTGGAVERHVVMAPDEDDDRDEDDGADEGESDEGNPFGTINRMGGSE